MKQSKAANNDIYSRLPRVSLGEAEYLPERPIVLVSPAQEKLVRKMRKAIHKLTGKRYEVWSLLSDGKTQAEIAIILSLSTARINQLYKQGLKKIRLSMKITP